MDGVAFSTLVIYLLVLPGILFQRAYSGGGIWFTGKGLLSDKKGAAGHPRHPSSARGFAEEIFKSVLTTCALHLIWGSIFVGTMHALHHPANVALFFETLAGTDGGALVRLLFGGGNTPLTIAYMASLYIAAPLMGRFSLGRVREYRLDLKSKAFRFNDNWYYLFRGEVYGLIENGGSPEIPILDHTHGSFVVGHGDNYYEYAGVIEDWALSSQGDLERIMLSAVTRAPLKPDGSGSTEAIGANFVVLEAKQIEAIQLSYRILEREV